MPLTIVTQKQPPGLHESRKAAFDTYNADGTLTSAQKTVCRAATLGLYSGQDSSGIWWVQCRDGWATGASQAAVDAYCGAVMHEVAEGGANSPEPSAEFVAQVISRAKWACLNYFARQRTEPGSLMFETPPTWAWDFSYGLTCATAGGQLRAKLVHPEQMKRALDALGVPASV